MINTGMQAGMDAGIEKVAFNLLSQGVDIEIIVKATGLTYEAIKKLSSSI